MSEGYSTAQRKDFVIGFGAGMALANIKKNTDEMILTKLGKELIGVYHLLDGKNPVLFWIAENKEVGVALP